MAGYLGVDSGLVLENFRKAATDRREKTLVAPVEPIRHDEKILLKLFLTSEEAREQPDSGAEDAWRLVEQFRLRGASLRPCSPCTTAGAPFGLAELDARLEEADRSRLASIVLGDETNDEDVSLQLGEACLEKLQAAGARSAHFGAQGFHQRSRTRGKHDEALRLYEDLHRFEKSQSAGDVQ